MKYITLIYCVFYLINCVFGQVQEGGVPESFSLSNKELIKTIPTFKFSLDKTQIKPFIFDKTKKAIFQNELCKNRTFFN